MDAEKKIPVSMRADEEKKNKTFMCIVVAKIKKTTHRSTAQAKKGWLLHDVCFLVSMNHNDDDLLENDGSGTLL